MEHLWLDHLSDIAFVVGTVSTRDCVNQWRVCVHKCVSHRPNSLPATCVAGRMLPDWTRGAFSVVSPKPASLRARKVPGTYQIPTGKPSHDIMFTRNNIHTD